MSRRARRRQERAKTSTAPTTPTTSTNNNNAATDEWGAASFKVASASASKATPPIATVAPSKKKKAEPPPTMIPEEPSLNPLRDFQTTDLTDKFEEKQLSEDVEAALPIKSIKSTALPNKPKRQVFVLVDVDPDAADDASDEMMELPTSALSLTTRSAPKYIMLKDQPCKIVEARMKKKSTNRGNDRIEVKGTHIVSGKLYQDTIVGTVQVPVLKVKFTQYTLLDVDTTDGSVSLMDENGVLNENAFLMPSPNTAQPFDSVGMDLIKRHSKDEELSVIVFRALGRDVVVEVNKDKEGDSIV